MTMRKGGRTRLVKLVMTYSISYRRNTPAVVDRLSSSKTPLWKCALSGWLGLIQAPPKLVPGTKGEVLIWYAYSNHQSSIWKWFFNCRTACLLASNPASCTHPISMLFGSVLQDLLELRSLVGFKVGNTPLGFLQLFRVKKWFGRLEVYIQCMFETWQGVVGQRLVKPEGTCPSIVGHRCQYLMLTYFCGPKNSLLILQLILLDVWKSCKTTFLGELGERASCATDVVMSDTHTHELGL